MWTHFLSTPSPRYTVHNTRIHTLYTRTDEWGKELGRGRKEEREREKIGLIRWIVWILVILWIV